jgi:TRC40/GET3/ArsA family transport-energizing ATPase
VLVLSTDPAHSLADALGVPLGPLPTEVDTGLYAVQVDGQRAFEQTWREISGYLSAVLERAGVDALQAEELTVLPGAEEVLALLELTRQVTTGPWDLVVVDCAPTGETLRLLALPEALSWYVERVFPAQRRALRAVRPLLSRVSGPAVPQDDVFDAVARLHRQLLEVRAVLTAPSTSVRLVLTPEAVVVAEARRTLTSLALYGYRVDALVANRVFPESADPFVAGWAAAQASSWRRSAATPARSPSWWRRTARRSRSASRRSPASGSGCTTGRTRLRRRPRGRTCWTCAGRRTASSCCCPSRWPARTSSTSPAPVTSWRSPSPGTGGCWRCRAPCGAARSWVPGWPTAGSVVRFEPDPVLWMRG